MARTKALPLSEIPKTYLIKGEYRHPRTSYTRKRERGDNKLIIYFHRMGQTILQNLEERHIELTDLFRYKWAEIFRLAGREDLVTALANGLIKVKWDQYAGCNCPCSPGFVVKSKDKNQYVVQPGTIWIDWSFTPHILKSRQVVAKPKYAEKPLPTASLKKVIPGFDQHVLPGLKFKKPESWEMTRNGDTGTYEYFR